MAQPESLLDLGQAADLGPQGDVHGALLSWLACGDRGGLAQDLAQLHQPLARLAAAALAGRRQRQHLGEAA